MWQKIMDNKMTITNDSQKRNKFDFIFSNHSKLKLMFITLEFNKKI